MSKYNKPEINDLIFLKINEASKLIKMGYFYRLVKPSNLIFDWIRKILLSQNFGVKFIAGFFSQNSKFSKLCKSGKVDVKIDAWPFYAFWKEFYCRAYDTRIGGRFWPWFDDIASPSKSCDFKEDAFATK